MLSSGNVDVQKPEDKPGLSPAKIQKLPTVDNRRPWLKPLEQTLGNILPFIGGFVWIWIPLIGQASDPIAVALVGAPLIILLEAACIVLLSPSRWAPVVVSLGFAFGELLAFFFGVPQNSHFEAYTIIATYSMALPLGVFVGFFFALVGAAIGLGINKVREVRQ